MSGKFLSKAVECGHLSGVKKIANHSVRKTSIGRLLDANCPETFVAQLSGHKSLNSLSHYKVPSAKHQRVMSNVLSGAQENQSILVSSPVNSGASTSHQGQPYGDQLQPSVHSASTQSRSEQQKPPDSALQPVTTPALSQSIQSAQLAVNPHEIFQGASIHSIANCSFNFYASLPSTSSCNELSSPVKHRRQRRAYFLDSDSESD